MIDRPVRCHSLIPFPAVPGVISAAIPAFLHPQQVLDDDDDDIQVLASSLGRRRPSRTDELMEGGFLHKTGREGPCGSL